MRCLHLVDMTILNIVKEGGLWTADPSKALPNLKRQIVIPDEVEEMTNEYSNNLSSSQN